MPFSGPSLSANIYLTVIGPISFVYRLDIVNDIGSISFTHRHKVAPMSSDTHRSDNGQISL